jgi:EAL domain-containing protein (putative c-di-GMP-specific phosphodiesterase class I)
VLLPSIADAGSARRSAEKIIALLESPIGIDSRIHHISASIGVTLFPADGATLEELMRVGDIAMYHAKERGRGKAEFYHPEMQRALLNRMELEEGLQRAFQNRELVLHYQPIVSADDFDSFGVEALLRWPIEDGTAWVSPSMFIPLAEENGLIVEMGDWVLQSTCEQFARWKASGVRVRYASVNVSVRQLQEPDYLERLLRALREHGMRGDELQIEITESVLAHEVEVKGVLGQIATQGVRLALDDFGTGYSSLGYLRTFPIDTVKMDRSFIVGVPQERDASQLVESIILMCTALGKKVVAEGIETDEQRRFLIEAGCATLQGYFLARPMEAADIPGFAKRLRELRRAPDLSTMPPRVSARS